MLHITNYSYVFFLISRWTRGNYTFKLNLKINIWTNERLFDVWMWVLIIREASWPSGLITWLRCRRSGDRNLTMSYELHFISGLENCLCRPSSEWVPVFFNAGKSNRLAVERCGDPLTAKLQAREMRTSFLCVLYIRIVYFTLLIIKVTSTSLL